MKAADKQGVEGAGDGDKAAENHKDKQASTP